MITDLVANNSSKATTIIATIIASITSIIEDVTLSIIVVTICCFCDLLTALLMNSRFQRATKSGKKIVVKPNLLRKFWIELSVIYLVLLSLSSLTVLGEVPIRVTLIVASIIGASKVVSCLKNYATLNDTKWAVLLSKYLDNKIDKLIDD